VKLIVLGTGVVAATGLSMALFGTGVAAADDYAGQTYADASSAAGDAGLTPQIVTRSGGALPDDECIVERSQTSSFFDSSWTNPGGKILFYLNCNQAVASAGTAGNSAASPEGRAELAKQAEEAAQQEAEEQAAREQSESAELEDTGNAPGVPGG
jgi:hypothetical protein